LDAIGNDLLHGVSQGRNINDLLDEATERWFDKASSLSSWQGGPGTLHGTVSSHRSCFSALAEPTANRSDICARQRQLLLLAGPRVDFETLFRPWPFPLVPEDVPYSPVANQAWFRVMEWLIVLFRDSEPSSQDFQNQLSRFVSRHALGIHKRRGPLGRFASNYYRTKGLLNALRKVALRTKVRPLDSARFERLVMNAFEQRQRHLQIVHSGKWSGIPAVPEWLGK
jgi:hypothetical protein